VRQRIQLAIVAQVILLVAASLESTYGLTMRHDREESFYIELATQFPSVGLISGGSAVLIAPNYVLTAAHVVNNLPVSSISFWFTDPPIAPVQAASKNVPVQYTADNQGWDIAVVRLSESILDVTPAELYTGSAELGEVGFIVGSGQGGNGHDGADGWAGIKRAGYNMIDVIGGAQNHYLYADFDDPDSGLLNWYGSPVPLDLECCIAPGDSGGGVFIYEGGQTKIAGINSHTWPSILNYKYGTQMAMTRVALFVPWINSIISTGVPDQYEEDDASSQANWIYGGSPQTHSISPADDADWFKFSLSTESQVTIETSGSSGDSRMWLKDTGLFHIEYDDNDGNGLFSRIDRMCEEDALPPGTYYVRIESQANNHEIPTYNISLTVTTCPDTTPPTPNPMTWSTYPYATSSTSIRMVATTASDPSGVEYYFDETSGNSGGSDSGWQDSTEYQDTGLQPNTSYTYRVKARDKSTNHNETGWSVSKSATTPAGPDTTPPTPNPMTWEAEPYETSMTSISMTATAATDDRSPPVYYEFDFVDSPTGGSGGDDRGWSTVRTYTDPGLGANHQYGYRVRARDSAPAQNTTSYSPVSYDYTDIETPSGITFGAITTTSIKVRSTNTPSGLTRGSSGLIVYNVTNGTNSGWKQNNDFWTSSPLSVNTQYGFKARARNGDADETGDSSTAYRYTYANPLGTAPFSNVTQTSIQANWTSNGNPSGTQYLCENTTKVTSSGWTSKTYWNESGLSCSTPYCYQVKAKNGDGVETASTSLGCQSTLPCLRVTLTASVGPNGSIEPKGVIDVNAGQNLTFTAHPNPDYTVDRWYLDANSVQIGGATYTLYNIQSDHTVHVTFKIIPSVIYVDVNSPNDPGSGTSEDPFRRIQDGINAAGDGTTVIVAQGTYRGNGNQDIDFKGKAINVRSTDPNNPDIVATTVIECQRNGRGFYFHSGEKPDSVINGFTISNGDLVWPMELMGSGIYCNDSSPTISNCVITSCGSAGNTRGGGIYCRNSSSMIINCAMTNNAGWLGGGLYFENFSGTVCNCTISNNIVPAFNSYGAGCYMISSSASILDSTISENHLCCVCWEEEVGDGGGIYCYDSTLLIKRCTISGNTTSDGGNADRDGKDGGDGAGIFCDSSTPTIVNSVITNNLTGNGGFSYEYSGGWGGDGGGACFTNCPNVIVAGSIIARNRTGNGGRGSYDYPSHGGGGGDGAGICSVNCSPQIINCTICGNSTGNGAYGSERNGPNGSGGGICAQWNSIAHVVNCIVWENTDQIAGASEVNYSCIQDLLNDLPGNGNIDADPCFADIENGDYHLKSQAGRWNPISQSWIKDSVTSPCIDGGDPNSDWTAELWPNGERINIGAYGGTPEASMSLSNVGSIANLDNDVDDMVDFIDLSLFVNKWCEEKMLLAEDLNRDGVVDLVDYAIFAQHWLEGITP